MNSERYPDRTADKAIKAVTASEQQEYRTIAYKFLFKPRVLTLKIKRKQTQVEELESCLLPSGIRYDRDKIQTSPEDKLPDIVGRITAIQKEIDALKIEKYEAINSIMGEINLLPSELQQTILTERFIGMMPMADIGESVNYSTSRAYQIMQSGIVQIGRHLKIL